ncbi:MAG: hypothetical protein ACT452_01095 [Microthrixaceae bacterium]
MFATNVSPQGGLMCDEHLPRLERWIRHVCQLTALVRALTTLVEDVTVFVVRCRALVIATIALAVTFGVLFTLR